MTYRESEPMLFLNFNGIDHHSEQNLYQSYNQCDNHQRTISSEFISEIILRNKVMFYTRQPRPLNLIQ